MEPSDYAALVASPAAFLDNENAEVRRLAVAACGGIGDDSLAPKLAGLLLDDPSPRVRAEAAEALGRTPGAFDDLTKALGDINEIVREAAATALGELENAAAVPALLAAATDDADRLVREAAIAALGAIEDDRALPVLLDTVQSGPPQLRRRAVVALSVFDGPEVEAALRAAANDRNPMVREAAEMVVGR